MKKGMEGLEEEEKKENKRENKTKLREILGLQMGKKLFLHLTKTRSKYLKCLPMFRALITFIPFHFLFQCSCMILCWNLFFNILHKQPYTNTLE